MTITLVGQRHVETLQIPTCPISHGGGFTPTSHFLSTCTLGEEPAQPGALRWRGEENIPATVPHILPTRYFAFCAAIYLPRRASPWPLKPLSGSSWALPFQYSFPYNFPLQVGILHLLPRGTTPQERIEKLSCDLFQKNDLYVKFQPWPLENALSTKPHKRL